MSDAIDELVRLHASKALVIGLQLEGADLGDRDLTGLKAERVGLAGSSLTRAVLSGASLVVVNLTRAKLDEVVARGLRVRQSTLDHAHFAHATLDATSFDDCTAEGANFEAARLVRANLVALDAPGSTFRSVDATGADFSRAQLRGSDFRGATLVDADFGEADLREVDFGGADLRGAWFVRSDLRGANLEGAKLDRSDFHGARVGTGPEDEGLARVIARLDQAVTLLEGDVRSAQSPSQPAASDEPSQRSAPSETWQFKLGNEYAPDSPWGMDLFAFDGDRRFRYEQRRAGHVLRARTGVVSPALHTQLLGWLRESGFPRVPDHPRPPGASYLTIVHSAEGNEQTALLAMSAAERMPGYGALLAALDPWATSLRSPEASAVPEGFSEDPP